MRLYFGYLDLRLDKKKPTLIHELVLVYSIIYLNRLTSCN